MVPHRGTNWAAPWLTSQIGRDAVLSRSYGRGYLSNLSAPYLPYSSDPTMGFRFALSLQSQIDNLPRPSEPSRSVRLQHTYRVKVQVHKYTNYLLSPGYILPSISASFLLLSPYSLEGRSGRVDPYLANFSRSTCSFRGFTRANFVCRWSWYCMTWSFTGMLAVLKQRMVQNGEATRSGAGGEKD